MPDLIDSERDCLKLNLQNNLVLTMFCRMERDRLEREKMEAQRERAMLKREKRQRELERIQLEKQRQEEKQRSAASYRLIII